MNNLKINWDMLSRVFIAAIFVFAGWGKITNFEATTGYINSVLKTGSITPVITALVIFIEIVVAVAYAYGKYQKDCMAYILIAFTALATIFFHNNFADMGNNINALKNLAIIGGLFATLSGVHNRRNSQA